MKDVTTEKLDWSATATAPKNYPMVILTPNIYYSEKGKYINLIPNMSGMQDGWEGSARIWASEPKPLPDHLSIVWHSLTENKIYRGNFELPVDKIYQYFKEGYMTFGINEENNNKVELHKETYDSITVGLAPQGMVVVWLVGRNKIEIGRYQAEEVDRKEAEQIHLQHYKGVGGENPIPMDKTVNEKELIAEGIDPKIIALALQNKITCKQWDDYRLRYNWKVVFNKPVEMYAYYIRYFDCEQDSELLPNQTQDDFNKKILEASSKVVPRKFGMYVTATNGKHYLIRLETLDEQETIEAFKILEAKSPNQEITLFIDVDDDFKNFTVTLGNDKISVLLKKCILKLFTLTKENDRKNEQPK